MQKNISLLEYQVNGMKKESHVSAARRRRNAVFEVQQTDRFFHRHQMEPPGNGEAEVCFQSMWLHWVFYLMMILILRLGEVKM